MFMSQLEGSRLIINNCLSMLVLSSVLSISSHTLNSEAFLVLLAALFHFFHLHVRAYQQEVHVHKICINIFEK